MLSNKEIGERVKELRTSLDLSQQELADRAGFASKASISRIENAQRDMTTTDVVLIAKALRTTVNNLLGWDSENLRTDVHTYVLNPTLASAGSSSYNDGYTESLEIEVPDVLLGKYAGRKDLQFVRVVGESMNNTIKNNSVVAYITEPSLVNLKGGDMICTHKPGQNNRIYYTACNLYSTGDRPFNFVFILLLLYQSMYSLIAASNSSIVL